MSGKKIGSISIMILPVILFGSKIGSGSTRDAIPTDVGRAVVCHESELIAPMSAEQGKIKELEEELEVLNQELANLRAGRKEVLERSIERYAERLYADGVFDTRKDAIAYATAYFAADYCP